MEGNARCCYVTVSIDRFRLTRSLDRRARPFLVPAARHVVIFNRWFGDDAAKWERRSGDELDAYTAALCWRFTIVTFRAHSFSCVGAAVRVSFIAYGTFQVSDQNRHLYRTRIDSIHTRKYSDRL
jgi:hypothetical protein